MLIDINIPVFNIIMIMVGVVLIGIYSTYPINKTGSIFGLVTKETLENEEIWRVANRFNGFTGFVAAITLILLSGYFLINGFNWVYMVLEVFICIMLMFYIPRLNAKRAAKSRIINAAE